MSAKIKRVILRVEADMDENGQLMHMKGVISVDGVEAWTDESVSSLGPFPAFLLSAFMETAKKKAMSFINQLQVNSPGWGK